MNIKYLYTYPFSMDIGGGGRVIKDIIHHLSKDNTCSFLDYESDVIDFDVLIVFGCTYINPHMLSFFKSKGVKVVLYPIFDRMKPLWQMKALKLLLRFPILNIYTLRNQIFLSSSTLITANESEKRDLHEIYNVPNENMHIMHYGMSDDFFKKAKTVSKDLFVSTYGWKDFVFCPAATISKRKNQLSLIKALKDTNLKLVLNNTQSIKDDLTEEFHNLTKNNPNILCLESLDMDMLISCYKAARVSVSVSQAETAGLVNLEAAYLGCNLVVSNLEALHEYLLDYAIFVDQNNIESIKKGVLKVFNKPYDTTVKAFIEKEYSWNTYIKKLEEIIAKV